MENVKSHKSLKAKSSKEKKKVEDEDEDQSDENKVSFKTKLGRNVYRVLFEAEQQKRNELFLPHRNISYNLFKKCCAIVNDLFVCKIEFNKNRLIDI